MNEKIIDRYVPNLEFKSIITDCTEYYMDDIVKILEEKYKDQTIYLVKCGFHPCLAVGCNYNLIINTYLCNKNYEIINELNHSFETEVSYVRRLKSKNCNSTNSSDEILILVSNYRDDEITERRIDRIIEREEKEQLNNTVYKISKSGNDSTIKMSEIENAIKKVLDNGNERKYI